MRGGSAAANPLAVDPAGSEEEGGRGSAAGNPLDDDLAGSELEGGDDLAGSELEAAAFSWLLRHCSVMDVESDLPRG
jgi:hypothetical protein